MNIQNGQLTRLNIRLRTVTTSNTGDFRIKYLTERNCAIQGTY